MQLQRASLQLDGGCGLVQAAQALCHGMAVGRAGHSPEDGAAALHAANCRGNDAMVAAKLLLQAGVDTDLSSYATRRTPVSTAGATTQPLSSPMRSTRCQVAHAPAEAASSLLRSAGSLGDEQLRTCHRDHEGTPVSTPEFRMYSFKVDDCPHVDADPEEHDWTECPFAHPGEKARRRCPRKHLYTSVPCPDFRKGTCKRGNACTYAHGVFEGWLHPEKYRTQMCKDGASCSRIVCFFAHTLQELRADPNAPKTPPASMSLLHQAPTPPVSGGESANSSRSLCGSPDNGSGLDAVGSWAAQVSRDASQSFGSPDTTPRAAGTVSPHLFDNGSPAGKVRMATGQVSPRSPYSALDGGQSLSPPPHGLLQRSLLDAAKAPAAALPRGATSTSFLSRSPSPPRRISNSSCRGALLGSPRALASQTNLLQPRPVARGLADQMLQQQQDHALAQAFVMRQHQAIGAGLRAGSCGPGKVQYGQQPVQQLYAGLNAQQQQQLLLQRQQQEQQQRLLLQRQQQEQQQRQAAISAASSASQLDSLLYGLQLHDQAELIGYARSASGALNWKLHGNCGAHSPPVGAFNNQATPAWPPTNSGTSHGGMGLGDLGGDAGDPLGLDSLMTLMSMIQEPVSMRRVATLPGNLGSWLDTSVNGGIGNASLLDCAPGSERPMGLGLMGLGSGPGHLMGFGPGQHSLAPAPRFDPAPGSAVGGSLLQPQQPHYAPLYSNQALSFAGAWSEGLPSDPGACL